MKRMFIVLVAVLLALPATLVSAQGVELPDLSRQTAASQWMRFNPNGPATPWGDHSHPVFGDPNSVTTCMSGGLSTDTSYGTPPVIDLSPITWTESCMTKGTLGANDGPIGDDLMPNMDQFTMTYTFDGLGASDLAPAGDDVLIFSFNLPGDVLDPAYCSGANTQLAIGYDFGGPLWMVGEGFPNDYFGGLGHISTLNIDNCQLSSTDFVVGDGNTLQSYPGNTLAAVGPNGSGGSIISGITRIPDGVTSYRPTIFHTNQIGNFNPDMVGHVWPSGGMTYSFDDVICLVDVNLQPTTTTVAETTTTTVADTTTTTAATTTTEAATTTTAAIDEPSDDGGGISILVWLFLVALVVFLIWWFFLRPRVPGTPPPSGPEGPIDPGDEDGPGPSLLPPEERETPHSCDWALYLLTASGEERIRGPQQDAHECCVYKVQVSSFVHEKEEAVKERQDLAEEGRERASVGGTSIAGMDADIKTGVRSWPYGEQGAMHGLGDMSEWPTVGPTPGPWPEYWQEKQFEEQLDAAYSSILHQETRVTVNFTDGCGESEHTFKYDAASDSVVRGTFECTNENTDPTCPVELTAAARARIVGSGDLDYTVDATAHSDVDELPVKIEITGENAEFRRADADSHRHDADRDRDVWKITDSGGDHGSLNSKSWSSVVTNHTEAHAGLMIPKAMWPTTDRVTAQVELDTQTELGLDGYSKPAHSPKSNCCAHAGVKCFCAPRFNLVVGTGNTATLTVDGITRNLSNSDPDSTTQTIIWD